MPDSNLLKKYNVQGPRYTSYPTVPYWDTSPDQEQWLSSLKLALNEAESEQAGAALYIHIPFCEQLCTFCGCNTRITKKHERGRPYIKSVHKEWTIYQNELKRDNPIPISEVHLGGGTPTWLTPEELRDLLVPIFEQVSFTSDVEMSFEADPRVTNYEHLKMLRELGFNRISYGIQDFDPKVQEIVNRVQSVEQVEKLTNDARELGYTSVNFDLIYGLPLQTSKSVKNTIEHVNRMKPDRIAFYSYAHVPWIKPSQRKYTVADLPDGDEKRGLYELGRTMFEDVGYVEVGMDHFALKSDGLSKAIEQGSLHRNFMGYMPKFVHPMISLGMSAISDSWGIFMQNIKELEAYEEAVDAGKLPILRGHVLTEEDAVLRRHVLNIMTKYETSWNAESEYTEHLEQVQHLLNELMQDGLVELGKNSVNITEKGKPFLRNICMAFDARLSRAKPDAELFSKTV